MACQWIVVHRLGNPKWLKRREPCGLKGANIPIKRGAATVTLCARHRGIVAAEPKDVKPTLFEEEAKK